jgi:glycosyltransferase involved in cell wall biosynthesis
LYNRNIRIIINDKIIYKTIDIKQSYVSEIRMAETSDKLAVTAVICTRNEASNIPYVLPRIPEWVDEVIVVDGHSTDNTVEVIKQFCPRARILMQENDGKGEALLKGIREAKSEIIVTLDADGETPPEEMENFVRPLRYGYDFVKGSRLSGRRPDRMSRLRWFGNKILANTCNVLFFTRFDDICSGYNAFKKEKAFSLDLSYKSKEQGCSMEQQMIVRARKAGMKIIEVSHTSHGRISGTSAIEGLIPTIKQGFLDWFLIIGERFRG